MNNLQSYFDNKITIKLTIHDTLINVKGYLNKNWN